MMPRRPKRLLILGLVFGNAFFLFWFLVGDNKDDNKDVGQGDNVHDEVGFDLEDMDKVALAMGRKMKIHGAHPQPKMQQSINARDELIIDEIENNSDNFDQRNQEIGGFFPKRQEPRALTRHKSHQMRGNGAPLQAPEKAQDNFEEEEEEEDEDDYKDDGDEENKDDQKEYVFQGMQRNKKRSEDLFQPAVGEMSVQAQGTAMNGTKYFSFDTRFVHHCITREIVGRIPTHVRANDLRGFQLQSPENGAGRKASFHKVFEDRSWGKGWDKAYDRLDASGRGAQLSWAQEFIATLQLLINDIKIKLGKSQVKILDVPCGDMAWMSRFLMTRNDVDYTGIDIVPELIDNHRKAYKSYPWKFKMIDLINHPLNESYDIIINRMLLQHLYYGDALELLQRFSESKSTFLVTTTFPKVDKNIELSLEDNPGRVRKLNLEIPPLSLTPPLCVTRDGPPDTFEGWDHFAGVWKLPLLRVPKCRAPKSMKFRGTDLTIHSCVGWNLGP